MMTGVGGGKGLCVKKKFVICISMVFFHQKESVWIDQMENWKGLGMKKSWTEGRQFNQKLLKTLIFVTNIRCK